MTTVYGIATTLVSVMLAIGYWYHLRVQIPRKRQQETERRRAELLIYLFKNRHIDILKMPTEDIIAVAKKLDDYISGKQ